LVTTIWLAAWAVCSNSYVFYLQFTERDAGPGLDCRASQDRYPSLRQLHAKPKPSPSQDEFLQHRVNRLNANCEVFDIAAQNWMLVIGGGLLVYIAVLVFAERRQPRALAKRRRHGLG
jgi:hypothetical protein